MNYVLHFLYLIADKIQFMDHIEFLKYIFNTCMANGRIKDAISLVRSQKKAHGYDYNFAFQEGIQIFE